jgi:hypothetical protein
MREIWHFGQDAIMAGCKRQVLDFVIAGLDPAIHPSSQRFFEA